MLQLGERAGDVPQYLPLTTTEGCTRKPPVVGFCQHDLYYSIATIVGLHVIYHSVGFHRGYLAVYLECLADPL